MKRRAWCERPTGDAARLLRRVGDAPAAEVDRIGRRVDEQDALCLRRRADGIDESAPMIRTAAACSCAAGGGAWPIASPVVSSVCQAWPWKARKIPTRRSSRAMCRISPPSCQTPLSPPNWPLEPWFMWMSCTPLPGWNPKILSGLPSSGPQRCQNAYTRAVWSPIARANRLPPPPCVRVGSQGQSRAFATRDPLPTPAFIPPTTYGRSPLIEIFLGSARRFARVSNARASSRTG